MSNFSELDLALKNGYPLSKRQQEYVSSIKLEQISLASLNPELFRRNFSNRPLQVSSGNETPQLKNVILNVEDSSLPVGREYLDGSRVAFLDPKTLPFIKRNLQQVGRSDIADKSDEEIAHSLVVIPRGTTMKEIFPKHERFRCEYIYLMGAILVIPITETEGYHTEQRYLYVGNFSHQEKVYKKASMGCRRQKFVNDADENFEPEKMQIKTLSVGHNFPAYNNLAFRVQLSVSGKNEVLFTHRRK